MSLCRPRKLLNVHFPHFLLSAFEYTKRTVPFVYFLTKKVAKIFA